LRLAGAISQLDGQSDANRFPYGPLLEPSVPAEVVPEIEETVSPARLEPACPVVSGCPAGVLSAIVPQRSESESCPECSCDASTSPAELVPVALQVLHGRVAFQSLAGFGRRPMGSDRAANGRAERLPEVFLMT
jgi:hypothetical protein